MILEHDDPPAGSDCYDDGLRIVRGGTVR